MGLFDRKKKKYLRVDEGFTAPLASLDSKSNCSTLGPGDYEIVKGAHEGWTFKLYLLANKPKCGWPVNGWESLARAEGSGIHIIEK